MNSSTTDKKEIPVSLNQDIFTLLNFVTMPHDITINENIKINQESSFDSNENSSINKNDKSSINKFWNTLNYYSSKVALISNVIFLITLYIVVIVILDLTYVHIKANPMT